MSELSDASGNTLRQIASHLSITDLINWIKTEKNTDFKDILKKKVESLIEEFNKTADVFDGNNNLIQLTFKIADQTVPYVVNLNEDVDGVAKEVPDGKKVLITKKNVITYIKAAIKSIEETIAFITDNLRNETESEKPIWIKYQTDFNNLLTKFNEMKAIIEYVPKQQNAGKKTCYLYKGTRYTKVHTVNKKKCIYSKKEDTYVPISSKSVKKV